MKIVSVNAARSVKVEWQGKELKTSIFKKPLSGPQMVNHLGLVKDTQSDPKHHGGLKRAIYAYDSAAYRYWHSKIAPQRIRNGLFGENLTTKGLTDDTIYVGNIYQIGKVILQAIEPRIPCYKLNIALGRNDAMELFYKKAIYGTYFSVIETGPIEAGMKIELLEKSTCEIRISTIAQQFSSPTKDIELCKKISQLDALSEGTRKTFLQFIERKKA